MSVSVNNSNFILFFIKAASQTNVEAEKNVTGSNSEISKHIFLKFLKISANNNF